MYFADATETIWFRVPYGNYSGYLANRDRLKEYTVTGKLAEVNNVLELVYDSSYTERQSVVNLDDDHSLSYNKTTTPISVAGIAEIKEKCGNIILNNKGHGAGDLVKFTSQIVQTEYNDANEKAMLLDSDGNTITVIGDGKKMVSESDIGKYYEWVGIISIEDTIPAIMGIECSYVSHTSEEEGFVDVSNATEVSPSYFAKWSLLSTSHSERNPASNNDYFKLYKSVGYITDSEKYTGSYHIGITDAYNQSISDKKTGNTNPSTKTIKGFYFVNYVGEKSCEAKVVNCIGVEKQVTVYYAIRDFVTTDHIWKMFVIEKLISVES